MEGQTISRSRNSACYLAMHLHQTVLTVDTAALQALMLKHLFLLHFKLKLWIAGKTVQAVNKPDTHFALAWQNYCSQNEIRLVW